jgi:hypothetical protein
VADPIAVEGLDELRKGLKALGDVEASREYKLAGYNAAAEVVIPRAQGRAGALGRMQARAAASLKPARSVAGGAVRYGGGVPFAMGAEFGSIRYKQFEPWRGSAGDAGYFLWPTLRDDAADIISAFDRALEPLYRRVCPD